MLQPTYPGVYTSELTSGVHSIAGVATSIAAFVGPARTGIDRRATRIQSFSEFERSFGGLDPDSEMSYAVMHFFQNGGSDAVIVRVPNSGAHAAEITADNSAGSMLKSIALGAGVAGNTIFIEVESVAATVAAPDLGQSFALVVSQPSSGLYERFSALSTDPSTVAFAPAVVNDYDFGSKLVKIQLSKTSDPAPLSTGTTFAYKQPLASPFGTALAKQCVVQVKIDRFDAAGNKVGVLDEPSLTVFNAGDTVMSLADLVQSMQRAINQRLRQLTETADREVGVEAAVLEFPTDKDTVRIVRFRTRSSTQPGDYAADAVIAIVDDSTDPLLSVFGLADQATNASRYRLGFDYTQDARVHATGPGDANFKPIPGDAGQIGYPTSADLITSLGELDRVDLFNLLCMPDAVRASKSDPKQPRYSDIDSIYTAAADKCLDRRAFLLMDPPPKVIDVATAVAWRASLSVHSDHAATYFPRLKISDPLNPGSLRLHPPSGSMAGVMARTDSNRGVWKAPAGIDSTLANVYAPDVLLSDAEHGQLNPLGINGIRQFPVYGTVAFGARTLAGADVQASPWKYVPVRRTALYILESLKRGLTWVVFEPNDEPLWSQVRMNATAFMQGLFRQGAFQGKSPRDAYLVKCDRETTTQNHINQGILNVTIGFAPLNPTEFGFITLQQLAGQAQN